MSTLPPPSYIDDGASLHRRKPHTRHRHHHHQQPASTTSAYTGSFIDDGADMLPSRHKKHGFAPLNPHFYSLRPRDHDSTEKKENKEHIWTPAIQKAITGDIQRSLTRIQGVGDVRVRRVQTELHEEKGEEGGEEGEETVRVCLPRKWGAFVIREGERVVLVDEEGEFDSGSIKGEERVGEGKRWIRAASTAGEKDGKRRGREKEKEKDGRGEGKVLTPVREEERASVGRDMESSPAYFMSGGASGWPVRSEISDGFTVKSAWRNGHSSTKSLAKEKSVSSRHSPPGAWPSPPQSGTSSESSSRHLSTREKSIRSGHTTSQHSQRSGKSHRSHAKDYDNVSTKTWSTYKAPTVEEVPETSSENGVWKEDVHRETGSRKSSKADWKAEVHASPTKSRHSEKAANRQTWTASDTSSKQPWGASVQNWVGGRVKTISETHSDKGWGGNHSLVSGKEQWGGNGSETSWDGYEKPKTMSEVSVAGTGSERSWPDDTGSSSSSTHTRSVSGSRREGSGSQSNWQGSQRANVDGWGGDETETETETEDGWDGSRAGRDSKAERDSNGYGDKNSRYLNEQWNGAPVRVGSRQSSAAGWL